MKKFLLSFGFFAGVLILFNGCGVNQGLGIGDYRKDIKHQFVEGIVVSSKKVLVAKEKLALVRGMGVGAVGGAVIGGVSTGGAGAVKGSIIGGVIGAIGGLATGYMIDGNEEEAYSLTLRKGLEEYEAFTKDNIPSGTLLEFVVREDKAITNISIVPSVKE